MPTITQHAPGTFCWAELGTTDQEGAKKFYTTLFGWTFDDNDMGEGGTYTMLKLGGREVGGLYKLQKDQLDNKVPPHWMSYVAVENADQSAAKVKQLGGTLMAEPFDVMDYGRMAVIQDPTGGVVSIWQPKKHAGAGVVGEPGSTAWNELYTPDPDKAKTFYTGLFGWKPETMKAGPPDRPSDYTMFKMGEQQAAGMMKSVDEFKAPPHWAIYFMADDVDATTAKAEKLGATIMVPPTDIPNIGRFSALTDPQGAHFSLFGKSKS